MIILKDKNYEKYQFYVSKRKRGFISKQIAIRNLQTRLVLLLEGLGNIPEMSESKMI